MKRIFAIALVTSAIVISVGHLAAQRSRARFTHRTPVDQVAIYVYPEQLTSEDQLTDGDTEHIIGLQDNTLLIWLDLEPGLFFAHPTAYILISADGVHVERGSWWPVLNGQTILYGQENRVPILSPFRVESRRGPFDVYFHPGILVPGNTISDGFDNPIPSESAAFMAWIDLHPELFFTHPTAYLLIGADKSIRVVDGVWWPLVNGKTVLYGSRNQYGIISPFELQERIAP